VVFNTSMSGYQEILTDPSYCRQIVTLTYPHIGNTGINREDCEADKVYAAGLVIRDLPLLASNWRCEQTLDAYLKSENIVAIAGIDTRKLTRILREKGAQSGCIVTAATAAELNVESALAQARSFPGLAGMIWQRWCPPLLPIRGPKVSGNSRRVMCPRRTPASMWWLLIRCEAQHPSHACPARLPSHRSAGPDACSRGPGAQSGWCLPVQRPGDPEPCDYAIQAIREILSKGVPTFGICLGHQLLALASGAKTMKMKFGHHGANHPVKDLDSGQVLITSQNHGFAVDAATLPTNLRATHVSLFDEVFKALPAPMSRPSVFRATLRASPGPHDVAYLFDRFISLMEARG
jgi:carbamoyl-phosphate synthase small subunit